MRRRHWQKLDPATTYTLKAENGWTFSMNPDGSVSLTFKTMASATAGVDLSVDPDPGQGAPYPPTQP